LPVNLGNVGQRVPPVSVSAGVTSNLATGLHQPILLAESFYSDLETGGTHCPTLKIKLPSVRAFVAMQRSTQREESGARNLFRFIARTQTRVAIF